MLLFIMMYKVALTFEPVDKIPTVLTCGTVYVVRGSSF